MTKRFHTNRALHFASLVALLLLPLALAACGGEAAIPSTARPLSSSSGGLQSAMAESTATTASAAEAPTVSGSARLFESDEAALGAPGGEPQPRQAAPLITAAEDSLSTFGMDVDTGSYAAARNYINAGVLPPGDTVRVEEFVNYFQYDYPSPSKDAFGIYIDSVPMPFGEQEQRHLVRVGIQGKRIDAAQRKDAVLTFVIDVSGSMQEHNRLPLVKQALRLLVNELTPADQVGIVVYGSNARVLLEHVAATEDNKGLILQAIDGLSDEGSTNAEAGLRLGYEGASKHFKPGAINRVILCSDGVANVGATSPDGIRASIRDYAAQGVYLTTVGFGMGGYNDYLMEQLADDGNGSYAYVDALDEAGRIFVENLTGTLQVIARDAKIQVEFDPAVVARYRLLGYENRAIAAQDFRNDTVDAGEVGAGHSVTALYEVELARESRPDSRALTVQVRYMDPQDSQVHEISRPFHAEEFGRSPESASPRLQLALAAAVFAEQLRGTTQDQQAYASQVLTLAQRAASALPDDADAQELAGLVAKAAAMGR